MRLGGSTTLRVVEESATGSSTQVRGALSYQHEGGQSYWVPGAHRGFEEWLELAPGVAQAGEVVARWRVEGHRLREVPETGGVHVLDSRAQPVAYVTAPAAWTSSGRTVQPELRVEDGAIVLRVDAGGEAVLVDPAWVLVGSMNAQHFSTPPLRMSAVALPDGRVLVAGGLDPTWFSRVAEVFDSITGTWSLTGSMNSGRDGHVAIVLPDGRVLVAGGYGDTDLDSTCEIFDPALGSWVPSSPMTARRSEGHAASLLHDGRVLVTGGADYHSGGYLASAELCDPGSGTWSGTENMSVERRLHTATVLPDGRILVVGGMNATTVGLASAEIYDPSTGSWRPTGSLSKGRFGHSATLLHDGRVLVSGGSEGDLPSGSNGVLASTEVFDPISGAWSATSEMDNGRVAHAAVVLNDGRVLVALGLPRAVAQDGAIVSQDLWLSSTGERGQMSEVYDATTDRWEAAGFIPLGSADASFGVLIGDQVHFGRSSSSITWQPQVCGDGIVQSGEECDDGNGESYLRWPDIPEPPTFRVGCCSPECQFYPTGSGCDSPGSEWGGACDEVGQCVPIVVEDYDAGPPASGPRVPGICAAGPGVRPAPFGVLLLGVVWAARRRRRAYRCRRT
ncbi:MAG: hypothetical protein H6719_29830 [Sandaracinaceae bacterium]|nr:hypothetical protein [Sandaracinaceae bacterium]